MRLLISVLLAVVLVAALLVAKTSAYGGYYGWGWYDPLFYQGEFLASKIEHLTFNSDCFSTVADQTLNQASICGEHFCLIHFSIIFDSGSWTFSLVNRSR